MDWIRFRWLMVPAVLVLLVWALPTRAFAAQTGGTSVYCLAQEDFSEDLEGIFVLSVPERGIGSFYAGQREIRPGDVLTADALDELTLNTCCKQDAVAALSYLPLADGTYGTVQTLSLHIRSGRAGVPTARDLELETYKNIPNDGCLKAVDEGGGPLTFKLETAPRQGTVELNPDGTFVYTPQHNKVGEDSFTYTVSDRDGNTSDPAMVRITVLKPQTETTYADMEQDPAAFEAQWLMEQGIFSGSMIGDHACFCPEQPVTRGEFLGLAMRMMELEPLEEAASGFVDEADAAAWMRPYLASAMRSGIVRGVSTDEGLKFLPNRPITCAEASVILQNLLRLPLTDAAEVLADQQAQTIPAWAADSVTVMRRYDLPLPDSAAVLSRADTACLLYQASKLS